MRIVHIFCEEVRLHAPTLIVPVFNEARRWRPRYWREVVGRRPDLQLVFVDDGSDDDTVDLLASTARDVGAAVVRQPQNLGKAEAVRRGLNMAIEDGASAVGFIDADGAFPAAEPGRLLSVLVEREGDSGIEAVWSSRVALAGRNISRSLARHYMGRVMATYVLRSAPGVPYDSQSGLKWFVNTPDFAEVLREPFTTRWLFEVELLARFLESRGHPLRIWEEPSSGWDEVARSTVTRREVLRIIRESRRARRLLRRASGEERHGSPRG